MGKDDQYGLYTSQESHGFSRGLLKQDYSAKMLPNPLFSLWAEQSVYAEGEE